MLHTFGVVPEALVDFGDDDKPQNPRSASSNLHRLHNIRRVWRHAQSMGVVLPYVGFAWLAEGRHPKRGQKR